MNWTRFRDQVGQWGPMASCALLSLGAFYLLILYGASLSKVILLGVMLICPAIYLPAWLLGHNLGGGRRAAFVAWRERTLGRRSSTLRRQRPSLWGTLPVPATGEVEGGARVGPSSSSFAPYPEIRAPGRWRRWYGPSSQLYFTGR